MMRQQLHHPSAGRAEVVEVVHEWTQCVVFASPVEMLFGPMYNPQHLTLSLNWRAFKKLT